MHELQAGLDEALLEALKERVAEVVPAVTRLRRQLHTQPEIHFQEFETRKRLAEALAETELELWQPLLGTDLIGELPGRSERCIVLRADIDALPILEQTTVQHKSRSPGMMHACGHDGHMAIMTGTALVLDALREHLPVRVRFVFQPGEEMVAGGKELVRKGCCRDAEAAFALHGGPGRPVGSISTLPGTMLAAADFFTITFVGKGGHGAMPELATSPLPIAAGYIHAMEQLHQELNAANGSVISVCSMSAGEANNVIPDTATLIGTTRYMEPGFGEQIEARMRQVAEEVCEGTGVRAEIEYECVYNLPLINDPESVEYLRGLVTSYLGAESWRDEPRHTMASEDFAFYLKERRGLMFWLGLGEEQPGLHSPYFDFNDDAIENGIMAFCLIALGYRG